MLMIVKYTFQLRLSPKLHSPSSNHPLCISIWKLIRHLKLNMSKTEFLISLYHVPILINDVTIPLVAQAKKTWSHPWIFSFPHTLHSVYKQQCEDCTFKAHRLRPLFTLPPITTLVEANISHLSYSLQTNPILLLTHPCLLSSQQPKIFF